MNARSVDRRGAARRLLLVVNDRASFVARRLPVAIAAHEAGFDVHAALPARASAGDLDQFTDLSPADTEAALSAAPITVHDIPLSRRGTRVGEEVRVVAALGALYARLRPAVVHHFTLKPILYGTMAAAFLRDLAVVNSFVGLGYVLAGEGAARQAGRAVVLGSYGLLARLTNVWSVFQNPENAELVARLARLAPGRMLLIRGSGVDTDRFAVADAPTASPALVVLPARMLRDKGVLEFVEAARALAARGVRARFALVGGLDPSNPASVSLHELEEWTSEGFVEWWGQRTDMPAVYREAAVVCLPSYAEGVPRSLLEAAAVGRPIVTTDVPGCREVVRHGETGLLVPVRDADALADALECMLTDAGRRAVFARAGRARVLHEFAMSHVIEQTLALYHRLAEPAGRPRAITAHA